MINQDQLQQSINSEALIQALAQRLYDVVSNPMPGNEEAFEGMPSELSLAYGVGRRSS